MKTETEGLSREEFEKQLKNYANQYDGANERAIAGFGFMAGWEARAASSLKQAEPDVETVSARVHERWMESKREKGVKSRKSESGEELMVPYAQLSEAAKDLDRGSVKAVLNAMAEGKQAEPPSQPAQLCQTCGHPETEHSRPVCAHKINGVFCYCPKFIAPVTESPSQTSTQPKCNCGAGDDAYLACHADVCALKKWAAPRYEISQGEKIKTASPRPSESPEEG